METFCTHVTYWETFENVLIEITSVHVFLRARIPIVIAIVVIIDVCSITG